jgi:hypothetical protein
MPLDDQIATLNLVFSQNGVGVGSVGDKCGELMLGSGQVLYIQRF